MRATTRADECVRPYCLFEDLKFKIEDFMENTALWKALGRNFGISIVLFGALLGLLWLVEYCAASFQLSTFNFQLLKWHDPAWVVGIPASVIGVAYILIFNREC